MRGNEGKKSGTCKTMKNKTYHDGCTLSPTYDLATIQCIQSTNPKKHEPAQPACTCPKKQLQMMEM